MKSQEIGLDAYKGTVISKGFESSAFSKMETVVRDNFEKGLIDADTFEKALGELDLLKGIKKEPKAVAPPAAEEIEKAIGEEKKEEKEEKKEEPAAKSEKKEGDEEGKKEEKEEKKEEKTEEK